MQSFLKVRLFIFNLSISVPKLCDNSLLFCTGQARIDTIKQDLITTLNELLKPAQLGIKSRLCEDNNEEYFALINMIESEAAKYDYIFRNQVRISSNN